jgi:hypothetical protein
MKDAPIVKKEKGDVTVGMTNKEKLMKYDKKAITELRQMLLGACHAEGCHRITKCPTTCSCKTRRTFKLNTETAICWVIADFLDGITSADNPSRSYIENIVAEVTGLCLLSEYHMTLGWKVFIQNIRFCIIMSTSIEACISCLTPEDLIQSMKRSLRQLKREPRE